jgi:hypothetical protein
MFSITKDYIALDDRMTGEFERKEDLIYCTAQIFARWGGGKLLNLYIRINGLRVQI